MVVLTRRQEAELKVSRFSLGVIHKIRNMYIRWAAQVDQLGEKAREARLT